MLRRLIIKTVRSLGYDIVKTTRTGDDIPVDIAQDETFVDVYSKCRAFTMTQLEDMHALYQAVRYVARRGIPGDFVECGVWKGGSAMLMARTLLHHGAAGRGLFLYDTYEGMPPPTGKDIDVYGKAAADLMGRWPREANTIWAYVPLEEVRRNLASAGYPAADIRYVPGRVEETIPGTVPERIALLRLDTDFYESTLHTLKHLYPRLSPGGIMIVDDCGHWQGAKAAVDEYFGRDGGELFLNRISHSGRLVVKREGDTTRGAAGLRMAG